MVHYFSKGEAALWLLSVLLILVSFFAFPQGNYLRLAASLIGVTSLIFCAKRKPGRTGFDDCFQHFVWYYFIFRLILWGNGDLSWNDDANGVCFAHFVGEKSI